MPTFAATGKIYLDVTVTGMTGDYSYRLHCLRQYWYDGKATITGTWKVDC